MKKILLIAVTALIIVGCSKKNSPTPPIELKVAIVGTWTAKADTEIITKDGAAWHTYAIPGYISLTFKNDGTGTKVWSDGPRTFTYTISDNKITFNFAEIDNPDGSIATAFSESLDVKTITSTRLVMIYQDDITQDGSLYHTTETQQFSK
ncbi:lipocalin family protein [Mucilaginibacter sp. BJC16-A38]|uniref:lipocalin family protein n=1 Tax=Mucilaginibacter phenanthrenivorans TaxID=1234842 RepID=UPI0021584371|nr:lipocalin family protein [Mucilaginibacter phenanthrenivorans]MCR8561845.1 lipocalin family protein [Mucilaginibacter phenanthrenivorans]